MKHIIKIIYLCGFVLLGQNKAFDPEVDKGQLYEYAEFANAGERDLSLDDILNNKSLVFSLLKSDNQSVGFTSDYYWVCFSLVNSSDEPKTYYLETARPITDGADLYQISGSQIEHFKSGDQIPFKERQVKHRATVFKIKLPANTVKNFYLELKSDGETINLPLNLYNESSFWIHNYEQQLFLGIFYGLLILAGVIYLFFYRSLLEKSFLYYGCYIFSIVLLQATLDGFVFQYIFPEGGFINDRAVLISALLCNLFLLKYCEHFLRIGERIKLFLFGFKGAYLIIIGLLAMVVVSPSILEWIYPISNINGMLSLVLLLATVFVMRYRRIPIDPYFSFGIFFLVIGLLGFVMNNLSLLPNNFFTMNSAKFGSGLEVIFLSLSMTNLIRNLRMEKEKSQELALQKSQEISELKSFFMSNMSHELRTPLNAIIGMVDDQLNDHCTANNRKTYEIIKHASLSLLCNINDVLDFEKIEKGELKLRMDVFDPLMILNQISENWRVQAITKKLDYRFEIRGMVPDRVTGDQERFAQIINNILSNAVKFTQNGSIYFEVSCTPKGESNYIFNFQVSDTGIGINKDVKAYIFDSFSQMRLNNKRNYGGIGLGLNIVKHLVELFSGSIVLESEINKGTVVTIEIPIEGVVQCNRPKSIIDEKSRINFARRILVVEDNAMNQMVMRKILGSWPRTSFVIAGNGYEAVKALKEDIFDIVLMDLQMPIMDGYEATKIIRNGELGREIQDLPIIAITADTTEETRQRIFDIGINDYMSKPVNRKVLLEKVDQQYQLQYVKTA